MRWTAILRKTTNEMLHDRITLFFGLVFPVLLVVVFGAAFGAFTGGNTTYEIAVINLDEGAQYNNTTVNHGGALVHQLESLHYRDADGLNSTHIFEVRTGLNEEEAKSRIRDQRIVAYVVIPANFSKAVMAEASRSLRAAVTSGAQEWLEGLGVLNYSDPAVVQRVVDGIVANLTAKGVNPVGAVPALENATATVGIFGDEGRAEFYGVSGIVASIATRYVSAVGEAAVWAAGPFLPFEPDALAGQSHVTLETAYIPSQAKTQFDHKVPGIMAFSLLINAMTVTIYLSREESRGTLARLKLTKMRSYDLLLGTIVPYAVLSLIQEAVLLVVAVILGYNFDPGTDVLLVAFITVWGCLASTALGLIIASFVRNEEQAGTLAAAVIIPISFLIGAWLPLPTLRLTDNLLWSGKAFYLFDWLPWTQCYSALLKAMNYGAGWSDVWFELLATAILTLALFYIGVALYHGRRLRSQ